MSLKLTAYWYSMLFMLSLTKQRLQRINTLLRHPKLLPLLPAVSITFHPHACSPTMKTSHQIPFLKNSRCVHLNCSSYLSYLFKSHNSCLVSLTFYTGCRMCGWHKIRRDVSGTHGHIHRDKWVQHFLKLALVSAFSIAKTLFFIAVPDSLHLESRLNVAT